MRIPGLRGLEVRAILRDTALEYLQDDMPTYAAALAYHLFFALFPFLLFLLALLGLFDLSPLLDELLSHARQVLPREGMETVEGVVRDFETQPSGGLLSVGILGAVWVSSTGMRSVMNALNKAYDIEEGRSRLERYSLSIVYTLGFTLLVVVATSLMVVGPLLTSSLASRLGLGEEVLAVWSWFRIPAALVLVMVAVSLVYYFAPNLRQRYRLVTPGALVAVLLWALVSVAFQFYVANFGRYSVTYGSIGAVIILLLYFFLSSNLLLLGGEMNAVIQRRAPRPDDPKPEAAPTT